MSKSRTNWLPPTDPIPRLGCLPAAAPSRERAIYSRALTLSTGFPKSFSSELQTGIKSAKRSCRREGNTPLMNSRKTGEARQRKGICSPAQPVFAAPVAEEPGYMGVPILAQPLFSEICHVSAVRGADIKHSKAITLMQYTLSWLRPRPRSSRCGASRHRRSTRFRPDDRLPRWEGDESGARSSTP